MDSSLDNLRDLWDKSAKTYSLLDDTYFPAKLKMSLLLKYARADSNCMDIGIANGIFSLPLSKFVHSIDGVDISQNMLDTCEEFLQQSNISNIKLHLNSAEELPFKDGIFDLTFSFATLTAVPDMRRAFKEIARTLKPGGVAILDITGRNNLSYHHWNKYYKSIGHFGLNPLSYSELETVFDDLGMEIIENHAVGVLDQWKYIPGLHKLTFIEKVTHSRKSYPDLDYRISNLLPHFANHFFLVLKKH
jgi:ubiquinone/menaquinone biosynthesis C-methylase UbiE